MASLISSKIIRRNSEPLTASGSDDVRRGDGDDDTNGSMGRELDDQPISPVTRPAKFLTSESTAVVLGLSPDINGHGPVIKLDISRSGTTMLTSSLA